MLVDAAHPAEALSSLLLFAAAAGVASLLLQLVLLLRHLREPPARPTTAPGISILKPLCGLDDALESNLLSFAQLAYPSYEVLLGVCDASDPAYPVARAVARRFPEHVRVFLQRGEP